MANKKQTMTIGAHDVAADLAQRGWARFDTERVRANSILAVMTAGLCRRLTQVPVKMPSRGGCPEGGFRHEHQLRLNL